MNITQTQLDFSGNETLNDATSSPADPSQPLRENNDTATIPLAKAIKKQNRTVTIPAVTNEVKKKKKHYDGEVFPDIPCTNCQRPTVWSSTAATGGKCICPNCDDSPRRLDSLMGRQSRKRYSGRWNK